MQLYWAETVHDGNFSPRIFKVIVVWIHKSIKYCKKCTASFLNFMCNNGQN